MIDGLEQVTLTPYQAVGIPIALLGGIFLAVGAQLQHRGVTKVEQRLGDGRRHGLSFGQLRALIARPSWLIGTLMLGLAIVLQLVSLVFAPLIVVQPLGVIALVVTAILNARISGLRLHPPAILAIVLCVSGVGVFVTIAALTAKETAITTRQLVTILIILAVVIVAYSAAFVTLRRRMRAVSYILAAGVLYGFVATLAKVVLNSLVNGNFEWLTGLALLVLIGASALGAYFVQNAYAVGSPDLVIAGLTVIDPMVAVAIGIVVLGEAAAAPPWAAVVYVLAAAVAVTGVFMLAKHHPQTRR